MLCIKADNNGECACDYAKVDYFTAGMVCQNPCVLKLQAQLSEALREKDEAERKLRHYRDAVRPIVDNCRAIIDAAQQSAAPAEPEAAVGPQGYDATDAECLAELEGGAACP